MRAELGRIGVRMALTGGVALGRALARRARVPLGPMRLAMPGRSLQAARPSSAAPLALLARPGVRRTGLESGVTTYQVAAMRVVPRVSSATAIANRPVSNGRTLTGGRIGQVTARATSHDAEIGTRGARSIALAPARMLAAPRSAAGIAVAARVRSATTTFVPPLGLRPTGERFASVPTQGPSAPRHVAGGQTLVANTMPGNIIMYSASSPRRSRHGSNAGSSSPTSATRRGHGSFSERDGAPPIVRSVAPPATRAPYRTAGGPAAPLPNPGRSTAAPATRDDGIDIGRAAPIDYHEMGRWLDDHLAHAVIRPQSGLSSMDERLTPVFPGAPLS